MRYRCIAINLGKLALLSIAMAQPLIMAGGTWIALRKLRSIQATPAIVPIQQNAGGWCVGNTLPWLTCQIYHPPDTSLPADNGNRSGA